MAQAKLEQWKGLRFWERVLYEIGSKAQWTKNYKPWLTPRAISVPSVAGER
jgi:hypothetical protein